MKTRGSASGWVIAAVVVALAAAGVWALFRTSSCGRQAPADYADVLVGAVDQATATSCRVRLSSVADALGVYALAHTGRYPPDLNTLLASGDLSPANLRCPSPSQQWYLYIAGQTTISNGQNVLVYEAQPEHGGRCHVLLVQGEVKLMTPGQLKAALDRTRAALAAGTGP